MSGIFGDRGDASESEPSGSASGSGPTWQRLDVVVLVVRLGLGGLFIAAGVFKWDDPAGFAQEIANYQLVPGLAPYLAVALPAVEVVAGAALLFAPLAWRAAGAAALAVLSFAFLVAVVAAVVRGLDISCGCFGGGSAPVSWLTVLRNLGLVAAAVWLVVRLERGQAGAPHPRRPSAPATSPR